MALSLLKISKEFEFDTNFIETADLISNCIEKFKNHPSIIQIKEKNRPKNVFSFSAITKDDILSKVKNLDASKTYKQTDIPTKILKGNSEYFAT